MTDRKNTKLRITDIHILDINELPPKYFFRPSVMDAIRREIHGDVVGRNAPLPTGAQVIYTLTGPRRRELNRHPRNGIYQWLRKVRGKLWQVK